MPHAVRRPFPRALIARVPAGRLLALAAVAALAGTTPCAVHAQTADAQAERRRVEEERVHNDWAYLARYRDENARLGPPRAGEQRVVFMGNSITQGWAPHFAAMFPGKPYVGRGISGQTTPQMLVRFPQDVIALRPAVVVILAGVNDIAGNTGPSTLEMIEDNLAAMVDLAHAHGIRVVLSSVLPASDFPWRPGMQPGPKIVALNAWMRDHAAKHDAVYLDYHSAMRDERQGMRGELAYDGVHPTEAGYRLMAPLAERAIAEALRRPAPVAAGRR
jgi:lysophospholipase L1-like esterase